MLAVTKSTRITNSVNMKQWCAFEIYMDSVSPHAILSSDFEVHQSSQIAYPAEYRGATAPVSFCSSKDNFTAGTQSVESKRIETEDST